jgi:glycosyl transferase family 2
MTAATISAGPADARVTSAIRFSLPDGRVPLAPVKVTVIVPVLYREPQLAKTLARLDSLRDKANLEILVVVDVPDPSSEHEARTANDAVAEESGARVLYRVGQRGFGPALRYAFGQGVGDAFIPFMGDESDRAEDIPTMVEALERGYDVVAGSRYMPGGQTVGITTKQRVSRLYSMLIRIAGGPPIHDVSNAFKAYRREVVEHVSTEAASFDISVELTVKAALAGFRVGEIPTVWTNRRLGSSQFKASKEIGHYWRWLVLTARGRLRLRPRRSAVPASGGRP